MSKSRLFREALVFYVMKKVERWQNEESREKK